MAETAKRKVYCDCHLSLSRRSPTASPVLPSTSVCDTLDRSCIYQKALARRPSSAPSGCLPLQLPSIISSSATGRRRKRNLCGSIRSTLWGLLLLPILFIVLAALPEASCEPASPGRDRDTDGARDQRNTCVGSGQSDQCSGKGADRAGSSTTAEPLLLPPLPTQQDHSYSTLSAVLEVPTGILSYAGSAIKGGWWYVKEYAHLGDVCPFAASPSEAVDEGLRKGIVGQPLAVEQLSREMRRWDLEMKLAEFNLQPIVFAVTGPTGVGKTETAWVVAESILVGREGYDVGMGGRKKPKGFVIFRGEDFADPQEPLSRYHSLIKSRLVHVLRECNGKAVVLFDEAQKMVPGVLDVLMEAMTERPALTIYSDGKAVEVDCSRVVFFLVSDIGDDAILSILQRYPTREEVPFKQLQWAVKMALDDQWEKLGLSKAVDKVVPYLPMRKEDVLLVLEQKLEQVSKDMAGEYFDSLYTTRELREALTSGRFIKYGNFSTEESLAAGVQHIHSIYGARDVERGPMRALKNVIGGYLRKNAYSVLDIRYVRARDEVAFYWCPWGYARGMDETQRDRWETVEGGRCEKAWQGVLESLDT